MKRIVLLLPLLLLFTGCVIDDDESDDGSRAQKMGVVYVDADALDQLMLSIDNGDIDVSLSYSDSVKIVYTKTVECEESGRAANYIDDVVLSTTVQGERLLVYDELPQDMIDMTITIDLDISLPYRMTMSASLTNGDILAYPLVGLHQAILINGNITATPGTLSSDESVQFQTTNGHINLGMNSNADFDFNVQTINGHISIEDFDDLNLVLTQSNHMVGYMNEGGSLATLHSTNGNITLRGE